jgi:hypothetical protein
LLRWPLHESKSGEKQTMKESSHILALTIGGFLALGCDGFVSVHGKAYRWSKAPKVPPSVILVDKGASAPIPEDLEPLEGVKITVYHSPEYAHRTDKTARTWRGTTKSEADGTFEDGSTCAPGSYDMAVGATRDGCQPILQTFHHSNKHPEHEVTIIMACGDRQQPPPGRHQPGRPAHH